MKDKMNQKRKKKNHGREAKQIESMPWGWMRPWCRKLEREREGERGKMKWVRLGLVYNYTHTHTHTHIYIYKGI